jgi:hypothetical protein
MRRISSGLALIHHIATFSIQGETFMKSSSRFHVSRAVAFSMVVFVLTGNSCSPKPASVAEPIAKAYGVDSFKQIDAIRYTFNAQFPGAMVSRSWIWEPKTGQVTYESKDKDGKLTKVTYNHSQMTSQSDDVKNNIDPGFVNDQYWLIFPFHAYWDTGANVQDKGTQGLPLGNGSGKLISVKYPSNAGYTPGDTWNLYVGGDNRVEQFVYQRGGPKKPSNVTATWEGYKKAGPLLISTEHRGTADGQPLHLWFSDVAVRANGSETWMNAE